MGADNSGVAKVVRSFVSYSLYLMMDYNLLQHALVECVPNFSEGRDQATIQAIADAIASVEGVYVLHVDAGWDANRTVVTFAGHPEAVVEAAFRGIKVATERIDMTRQQGEHPRIGATDVCPLVPVQHISWEELLPFAEKLGQRLGHELGIPVYLYEKSARAPHRTRLEQIRKGQYEALPTRMQEPGWQPDYGPGSFQPRCGATVLGVRPFLVAYNINLETQDADVAQAIAERIRQSGYYQTLPDGTRQHMPGLLSHVKAIGWYMEKYGCAQVSTNVTDYEQTPLYLVYDAVADLAEQMGTRATGSELIGLVPKQALLDTGRHLMRRDKEVVQVSEEIVLRKAIGYLGLDSLHKFKPVERILEFALGMAYKKKREGNG